MIRYAILTTYVAFFCAYAFKDWYRALLGLLFLVAFMERPDMPEAMFGIPGLAPFNILLVFVVLGYLGQRSHEVTHWKAPPKNRVFLIGLVLILAIGVIRMVADMGAIYDTAYIMARDFRMDTGSIVFEYFATTIKWAIPGLLVMAGCNSEKRLKETMFVMMLVVVLLALQILKVMPLTLIADGHALQKRAVRVMDRDVGFHRNQLGVWMASGFWFVWLYMTELADRTRKFWMFSLAMLIFFALIMTGSRGGLLCWGLTGCVFAWVRWRKLLLLGPAIVLVAVMLIPALQERVTQGLSQDEVSSYVKDDAIGGRTLGLAAASSGRTIFWAYSIPKIMEKPFFGWGRRSFIRSGVTLDLYETYDLSMAVSHPHNAYLQTVFDNGIFGALFVVAYFVWLATRSYGLFKSDHRTTRLVGGLGLAWICTYLISGITASTFYPNEGSIFLWAIMGLVAKGGVGLMEQQQAEQAPVLPPHMRVPGPVAGR
ncbi:MAG: O-antigen ligase family protein [Pseudomonadales bacterium]